MQKKYDNIDEAIENHLKSQGIDVKALLIEMINDGYIAFDFNDCMTPDLKDLSHGSGKEVSGSIRKNKD